MSAKQLQLIASFIRFIENNVLNYNSVTGIIIRYIE